MIRSLRKAHLGAFVVLGLGLPVLLRAALSERAIYPSHGLQSLQRYGPMNAQVESSQGIEPMVILAHGEAEGLKAHLYRSNDDPARRLEVTFVKGGPEPGMLVYWAGPEVTLSVDRSLPEDLQLLGTMGAELTSDFDASALPDSGDGRVVIYDLERQRIVYHIKLAAH